MLVLLAFVVVNGLIALINDNKPVGSFFGALLFLPQAAINLVLVIAAFVGVLVPCAIAIEDIGTFRAISRAVGCVRGQAGQLIVQFALTVLFGGVVMTVLTCLVSAAMAPTLATNGPSGATGLESIEDVLGGVFGSLDLDSQEWGNLGIGPSGGGLARRARSDGQSGDRLREFFIIIISLTVLAFPAVYWVVSFTGFYDTARVPPALAHPRRQPAAP
jgi:hypothetical protein